MPRSGPSGLNDEPMDFPWTSFTLGYLSETPDFVSSLTENKGGFSVGLRILGVNSKITAHLVRYKNFASVLICHMRERSDTRGDRECYCGRRFEVQAVGRGRNDFPCARTILFGQMSARVAAFRLLPHTFIIATCPPDSGAVNGGPSPPELIVATLVSDPVLSSMVKDWRAPSVSSFTALNGAMKIVIRGKQNAC